MKKYYIVNISAENKNQADKILNSLLAKRLVTGGQFLQSPARFLWKGKVADMAYVTITSYTTSEHSDSIISDVRKNSVEDVPMITFVEPASLNPELKSWIDETVSLAGSKR